jgi:hypothetical protein
LTPSPNARTLFLPEFSAAGCGSRAPAGRICASGAKRRKFGNDLVVTYPHFFAQHGEIYCHLHRIVCTDVDEPKAVLQPSPALL